MKSTRFDFHGAKCSFYGFYLGFGLAVSAYLLLSAVITWRCYWAGSVFPLMGIKACLHTVGENIWFAKENETKVASLL